MGDTTAISWAHHTFNPWEGCTRLSPACDNCYAADRAHRFGNDHLWAGELRRTSPANWAKPLRWNREAEAAGERRRVFCASLADVFDNQAPQEWRADLWRLIEATPHLTWMLLTKRPQNVIKMMPRPWLIDRAASPRNIWLGTTAEDQERANQRIGTIMIICGATGWLSFVSAEPLLGELDLTSITLPGTQPGRVNALTGDVAEASLHELKGGAVVMGRLEYPPLGLVIAGGESGPKARPSNPAWFRKLRDDCTRAGVPFHFKQWGEWVPAGEIGFHGHEHRPRIDMPPASMMRVGVANDPHRLDGIQHLAMPEIAA